MVNGNARSLVLPAVVLFAARWFCKVLAAHRFCFRQGGLAHWQVSLMGRRDCQDVSVGLGCLGCGILPASVSSVRQAFRRRPFPSRVESPAPKAFFSSGSFFCQPCGLTMRAADVWESARFIGFFHALSFFCSHAESTPAHTRLTPAVGRLIRRVESLHQSIKKNF